MTPARGAVLQRIADLLAGGHRPHPLRVAVDGPDASGKTTLADELGAVLRRRGRAVVRVSVDGFLRPRRERSASGAFSPHGYYHGAFDVDLLVESVLRPLRAGGARMIRGHVYDYATDTRTVGDPVHVDEGAVVIVDGVFLQRPELTSDWDVVVYVDVSEGETLRRARPRDAEIFGSVSEVETRYRERYLPAQRLYRDDADPVAHAHVVVDNEDPARPVLLRCDAP